MKKEERKEKIENIAKKISFLDEHDVAYISGYIAGRKEEREKRKAG